MEEGHFNQLLLVLGLRTQNGGYVKGRTEAFSVASEVNSQIALCFLERWQSPEKGSRFRAIREFKDE